MSEITFKTYGELEISEALSDASHVIIEENGDVKRFPVNSIGKVKTVNGIEPDENGNATVSWDNLENKPFGKISEEEAFVVESEVSNGGMIYFKDSMGSVQEGLTYAVYYDGKRYECVGIIDEGESVLQAEPFKIIDCLGYGMVTFTNGGTHTISVFILNNTVKFLSEEYIPDTIARTKDIPEVNYPVTSVNGQVGDITINTENVLDRNSKLLNSVLPEGYPMKVATTETLLPDTTITDGYIEIGVIGIEDGKAYTVIWDEVEYADLVATRSAYGQVFLKGDFPFEIIESSDDGYCAVQTSDNNEHTITILAQTGITNTPMSSDYLPKATAIADLTAAPTMEDFNNLLAVLRNAGYLATE